MSKQMTTKNIDTRPKPQRPVRTVGGGGVMDKVREDHPAFALIGASRVSAVPGATLFNSDFRHQHYIVVRIKGASLRRDLSNDWIHGDRQEYIEVALSEAQWATFISTLNVGDGVPATLKYFNGEVIPGIEAISDRREQFRGEVNEHLQEALGLVKELTAAIENTPMSAKAKRDLQHRADVLRSNLGPNINFVAEQFDEHAEKTVERAKIEVEGYMTRRIMAAGLEALGGHLPLEMIEGSSEVGDES